MNRLAPFSPEGDGLGPKTRHFQQTSLVIFPTRDFLENPSNPSPPVTRSRVPEPHPFSSHLKVRS